MIGGRWRRISGVLAAVCWTLAGMTAVILMIAGDAGLLTREMRTFAPAETTGLPAAEYEGVGRMIADYLTDRRESFQYFYSGGPEGTEIQCFQPHEEAHMADVRELIRLDRTVMVVALGIGMMATAAGLLPRGKRELFWRGVRSGLRGLAILGAVLLIWALVNFDGFFVTFHRLAFRNDGWLLDPRTDLLIRLMPIGFFISLGWKGAAAVMTVPMMLTAAERLALRKRKETTDDL